MQLAYSSNAFTKTTLVSAIKSIHQLGYKGVEILCDFPHWIPGQVTPQELEAIIALLAELNIKVSNLNANTANIYYDPLPPENVFEPALSNADKKLRLWRQNYTIEAIKLAKQLGATCVSITSGRPTPGCMPDTAMKFFVESVKYICDVAHQYDIRIGIEYEPGLLVERADEVLEVIAQVESSNLGANLDIGHSHLIGEEAASTVKMLGNRIWNVHVEDIKAKKHFHLIPGRGDLPFAEYFQALRDIDYQGFLTVELYSYPDQPVDAGRQAHDYLSKLLNT